MRKFICSILTIYITKKKIRKEAHRKVSKVLNDSPNCALTAEKKVVKIPLKTAMQKTYEKKCEIVDEY